MYCHIWKNTPPTDLHSHRKLIVRSRHFSSDINIKYYLSGLILEFFYFLKSSQAFNSVSFPF